MVIPVIRHRAQPTVTTIARLTVTAIFAYLLGVLLAVGLSAWVGFTWWSLGLTIAIALAIGYALRPGDNILEDRLGDAASWLRQARTLSEDIRRVDDAIRQAEESLRLNPRGLRLPDSTPSLREALGTLEHEAITVRLLARSLADSAQLTEGDGPLTDPDTRENLAHLLAELAAAIRTYGQLAIQHAPAQRERLQQELELPSE